jgi:hypothetical protein
MSGAISLLPPYVFMACMGIALPFYFLPPQNNMYRSICVEIKRHRSCVLPSPNYVRWHFGLRLVEARMRIVSVSTNPMKKKNKGSHNLTLFGALTKLSLLRVVINQNEIDKRKCQNFKIFFHKFFKLSTPCIFAGSHSFYSN